MKRFILSLCLIFVVVSPSLSQDDLFGANTNVPNPAIIKVLKVPTLKFPNPAIIKVLKVPTLKLDLLSLNMFSLETLTYSTTELNLFNQMVSSNSTIKVISINSSNFIDKVNSAKNAWAANIDPRIFESVSEWVASSKSCKEQLKIPINVDGIKMIAEVATPMSSDEENNQNAELSWAKEQGYNSALLVWRGENPLSLSSIASRLKSDGWKVFFAYSPTENKLFDRTPKQIQESVSLILPQCDGVFLGWRVTSIPHFFGNKSAYYDIISNIYRSINPKIPLIGETFITADSISDLNYSSKSATLLVNVGYSAYQPKAIMSYLKSSKREGPFLSLIIGKAPYYNTVRKIEGYTAQQAVVDKQKIESNFLNAGFATVTLVGDGFGERSLNGVKFSDSLTQSQLRNAK